MAFMAVQGRLGGLRILRPLGIRDFALLWTGMTVSLLGDGIYFVAIAWQVYELSNAPTALSIVGVAWTLPQVLFLLLSGVISDRFDRRRVMILADVLRGVHIFIIGLLAVSGTLELWHLLVLVAFYGAGEALFWPSFTAIVPDIVPQDLLVEANSLDIFVRTATSRLSGPALGGLAIGAFGTGGAFLLDAGSFALSALALLAMTSRPVEKASGVSMRQDIAEGVNFIRSQTWLWGTLVAASVTLSASSGRGRCWFPTSSRTSSAGAAADLGFIFGAGGLGAVLSSLILAQRHLPRKHITFMYAAWTVSGFAIVVYGVATEVWHAMLGAFVGAGLRERRHGRLDDAAADARADASARPRGVARLVHLDRPHPGVVRAHGPDRGRGRRPRDAGGGRHPLRRHHARIPVPARNARPGAGRSRTHINIPNAWH